MRGERRLEADPSSNRLDVRTNVWVLAWLLTLLAVIWPALWNGFPIVFPDTGGYLARPFEATLLMGRSAIYGAFLVFGAKHDFWPNIIVQGVLVTWPVLLTLRLEGLGGRPWLAIAILIGLCVLTSLPWFAAQLMPDIMVPIFVLDVALLAFHADGLSRKEAAILVVVVTAAIASHMSILALALGIVAFLAIARVVGVRIKLPQPALLLPVAAIAGGVVLAPLSNFAITGRLAFTPGGFNFVFSRLVQDGIVDRYLADRCPSPAIGLCAYQGEMPQTADDWLWALDSPIYKLGGLEPFEPEARRIVLESLALYPAMHLKAAIVSAAKQFAAIATGDGLTPWSWYTRLTFERYAPSALNSYISGRQALSPFDFGWINFIHVPIQALAIAALPMIILARPNEQIAALAAFVLAALVGNAVICGVLSNPHDRYQSRLVWLAPLIVAIGLSQRLAICSNVRNRDVVPSKTDAA